MDGPDSTFHRGYARPRMWSQYGSNHRGICLVLDREHLNSQIETHFDSKGRIFCGTVSYVNQHYNDVDAFTLKYEDILEHSLDAVIQRKIEDHHWSYFFTKAEDWESELEWRWVHYGQDSLPEYISIERSLKAIVLGVDFPVVYEPAMIPFGQRYGVPIARITWRNGLPVIVPGPYDPNR